LERQNQGLEEQVATAEEELADKEGLLAQQLTPKDQVLALRRLRSDLKARAAANDASIARAGQRKEEVALNILALETQFQDEIANELAEVNREIAQLEEAMTATEDVFRRTEIKAPVAGTVLNLKIRTIGGIVQPGEPILDIVPSDDKLVIEARLSPNDIDSVAVGQAARVHLTPYASRDVPSLAGRLAFISPDSTYDERTQQTYYALRVEVDSATLAPLPEGVELFAGMPAEVFIVTGEQSLFGYFAAPVIRSFRRAFTEE
jgi:HlyD family type I secretion membrane fusion protein